MDMALEYSVMGDLFDEAVSAAMEGEFKDYMSTTKGAGRKVIAFIRFILQKIVAAIRKVFAYVVNFFKNIRNGWGAVKEANRKSAFMIEVQRIGHTWGPKYTRFIKDIVACGIAGQRYADKAYGKVASGKLESIADKIEELDEKVVDSYDNIKDVEAKMQEAIVAVKNKSGLSDSEANDINFGSKRKPRDTVSEIRSMVYAYVKKPLENDVINYLKTADEKYSALEKKFREIRPDTEDEAYDAEGAAALNKLNDKITKTLYYVFDYAQKGAKEVNANVKIKGSPTEPKSLYTSPNEIHESAINDPLVNAILG